MQSKLKPRIIVEAVVIRKDGTQEKLGVISDSKKENLFRRILRRVKK